MARGFKKCLRDYFGKTEKQGRNLRVLDDLKISKVVEISSTVAIIYHRYERRAVLKMFSRLLSASRGLRNLLKETVYK